MAKILVTGSTGFVGSHLVALLDDDHDVHCLQNNLLDFNAVTQEVLACSPDIIIHLAARTEVEKSFYEQVEFSQINYTGSVNLIEAAAQVPNLKNFLFASTMEVYGWQPISDLVMMGREIPAQAFDETTPTNPNAPYAVAKLAVEKYLQYMHRSRGFPFAALRQTNSYGRKDNDFFVTEQIINQMLHDPDDIYLGYRQPYRNFLHIDDLMAVWLTLVDKSHLLCDGKIMTIGPDRPVQIEQWAGMIAKKIGWAGRIHWDSKPKRPGEIYWLNSNHDLITAVTGWQPKIDYDAGLDQTIEIWDNKRTASAPSGIKRYIAAA